MKRQIIITIDPAPDGVRCGGCRHLHFSCDTADQECWFGWVTWPWDSAAIEYVATRGPLCLAAEARYRALVEAGNVMGNLCGPHTNAAQAWIRAVEEAGKNEG